MGEAVFCGWDGWVNWFFGLCAFRSLSQEEVFRGRWAQRLLWCNPQHTMNPRRCGYRAVQVDVIGKEEPLSEEKLCPVLAMYRAPDFKNAVTMADKLINMFGPGHTR